MLPLDSRHKHSIEKGSILYQNSSKRGIFSDKSSSKGVYFPTQILLKEVNIFTHDNTWVPKRDRSDPPHVSSSHIAMTSSEVAIFFYVNVAKVMKS